MCAHGFYKCKILIFCHILDIMNVWFNYFNFPNVGNNREDLSEVIPTLSSRCTMSCSKWSKQFMGNADINEASSSTITAVHHSVCLLRVCFYRGYKNFSYRKWQPEYFTVSLSCSNNTALPVHAAPKANSYSCKWCIIIHSLIIHKKHWKHLLQ